MDASFLTYEGIATDPVETHLNLTKPVYILGQHFKPDERKFFFLQKKKKVKFIIFLQVIFLVQPVGNFVKLFVKL